MSVPPRQIPICSRTVAVCCSALFLANLSTSASLFGQVNDTKAVPALITQDIFSPGEKHAHASSIIECGDGQLVACWFLGSGERKANDVLIQGSIFDSRTSNWCPPFTMADVPGFPDCNPVLFVDSSRRMWMFWTCVVANRWECSQLHYRWVDLEGEHCFVRERESKGRVVGIAWDWQGVILLKPGEQFAQLVERGLQQSGAKSEMWAEYAKPYARLLAVAAKDPQKRQMGWMTRIHPQQLPTGRILLPLYSDGFNLSIMALSDDQGKSWFASAPIVGLGPIQPSVVRKNNGTLVAFCRDAGERPGRVLASESQNDGASWSVAKDTDLLNPGSSLEVLRLRDGRWMMVGNDSEENRRILRFQISPDEGATWTPGRLVEKSSAVRASFSYPSLIQSRDGTIHLTYSFVNSLGKETIRHTRVLPAFVDGQSEATK